MRAPLEGLLQATLEALYRVEAGVSVDDFCIGREHLDALLGAESSAQHRETLVVHHDGEETHLALFIAEEVRVRARTFWAKARRGAPDGRHLDEFCVATEGVSHFLYFTFAGGQQERPVSQLELELQAEIDKYLLLRLLLPAVSDSLCAALFDRFRLASHLSREAQERYVVANRAGRRYARWLEQRFRRGETERAVNDARTLYRKPFAAKLEHIDQAA